jgi:hypothetical protein
MTVSMAHVQWTGRFGRARGRGIPCWRVSWKAGAWRKSFACVQFARARDMAGFGRVPGTRPACPMLGTDAMSPFVAALVACGYLALVFSVFGRLSGRKPQR